MKSSKAIFTLLFALLILSVTEKNEYTIQGSVKNASDGTQVLLMNMNSQPLDTTWILNETFEFRGNVTEPEMVIVFIPSTMDFKSFWLEEGVTTFDAELKNFAQASILGSSEQQIQNRLNNAVANVQAGYKENNRLYFTRYMQYPDSIFNDDISKKYQDSQKAMNKAFEEFIRQFPNSLASVKLLNDSKTIFKKELTSELFNLMNTETQDTHFGSDIFEYISKSINLNIGDIIKDFEQQNPKGEMIRLSDHLGKKYTLLEFWASWCGPCRRSNPKLVGLYNKYKEQGFEVFGVSLDESEKNWVNAIKKDQLSWPNVSDLKGYQNEIALTFNIAALPNSVLIDAEGKVIAIGLRDGHLREKLEELFGF